VTDFEAVEDDQHDCANHSQTLSQRTSTRAANSSIIEHVNELNNEI
jgi:hypothetical protein